MRSRLGVGFLGSGSLPVKPRWMLEARLGEAPPHVVASVMVHGCGGQAYIVSAGGPVPQFTDLASELASTMAVGSHWLVTDAGLYLP